MEFENYEEQLKAIADAIKVCDDYLSTVQFDKMEGDMDTIDTVLDRRAQLLKMQAQTQEILDNEAKMENEASEKKKSRWGTWILGGLGIGAPLWLHNRQFNKLGEIEQWETVHTSAGRGVLTKMGQLLNFKK